MYTCPILPNKTGRWWYLIPQKLVPWLGWFRSWVIAQEMVKNELPAWWDFHWWNPLLTLVHSDFAEFQITLQLEEQQLVLAWSLGGRCKKSEFGILAVSPKVPSVSETLPETRQLFGIFVLTQQLDSYEIPKPIEGLKISTWSSFIPVIMSMTCWAALVNAGFAEWPTLDTS